MMPSKRTIKPQIPGENPKGVQLSRIPVNKFSLDKMAMPLSTEMDDKMKGYSAFSDDNYSFLISIILFGRRLSPHISDLTALNFPLEAHQVAGSRVSFGN